MGEGGITRILMHSSTARASMSWAVRPAFVSSRGELTAIASCPVLRGVGLAVQYQKLRPCQGGEKKAANSASLVARCRRAPVLVSAPDKLVEPVVRFVLVKEGELAVLELVEELLPGDGLQAFLRFAEVKTEQTRIAGVRRCLSPVQAYRLAPVPISGSLCGRLSSLPFPPPSLAREKTLAAFRSSRRGERAAEGQDIFQRTALSPQNSDRVETLEAHSLLTEEHHMARQADTARTDEVAVSPTPSGRRRAEPTAAIMSTG